MFAGIFGYEPLQDIVGGLFGGGIKDLHAGWALFGGVLFSLPVKYDDDSGSGRILISSEAGDELLAGGFRVPPMQGAKLRPGEDHAMGVDE